MSVNCDSCGARIPEGAGICDLCGTPVDGVEVVEEGPKDSGREEASLPTSDVVYCTSCGHKNAADANFCSKCGNA